MDIMCLMGLFPNGYEDEISKNSITGIQNAANKLQWGLVTGLDACEHVNVSICNSLYIGAYPRRYRKVRIPTFSFKHCESANDINVGFINFPLIKHASRYIGAKRTLKRWAAKQSKAKKILLVYAMTTPFVQLAGYIQKRYPDIKVCIVVPDLPEYMNVNKMQKKGMYTKLKNIEIQWLKHCSKSVRFFVLLTEAMKKWFEHDISCIVIEGIASVNNAALEVCERERTIIYAGGIKKEYGVLELVEAFMRICMPEWRLVLYGDGSDLEAVREIAKKDNRVVLMGMQPNSIVVEHQKRASLLVNPRKNQEFTKYSFPSKMLEYMSSGTPVIAYKLDGVPDEYDPYYYCIEDSEDGMIRTLERAMRLNDTERIDMGSAAYKFVCGNKTPEKQAKRIVAFLEESYCTEVES